jgi:hypothetical protein
MTYGGRWRKAGASSVSASMNSVMPLTSCVFDPLADRL